MNFGQLKARLLAQIGRAPSDLCYELTTSDINQRLRVRAMEATATLVESAQVTLPADCLQVLSIMRDTNPPTALYPISPGTKAVLDQGGTGVPAFYEVVDGALRLHPVPNGTFNLQMRYFGTLADLAADGDVNDVLSQFPGIYVYGVLSHHAALTRDEKALAIHFPAFERAISLANADDRKARIAGLPGRVIARTA